MAESAVASVRTRMDRALRRCYDKKRGASVRANVQSFLHKILAGVSMIASLMTAFLPWTQYSSSNPIITSITGATALVSELSLVLSSISERSLNNKQVSLAYANLSRYIERLKEDTDSKVEDLKNRLETVEEEIDRIDLAQFGAGLSMGNNYSVAFSTPLGPKTQSSILGRAMTSITYNGPPIASLMPPPPPFGSPPPPPPCVRVE